ncbi:MAG TPA: GNAT family protein [Acidimicrobiales bacterium]|jgi:RimJ/RimL family protein N-acetyltransferase|nr:GNAT family protein [Acidimicrobiales bacterium]
MAHPYWPLFDLVVRTPRLELRPPDDDMLVQLADAADPAMFPEGEYHFVIDWLSVPSPLRQRQSMQFWWSHRANWTVDDWSLTMAVVVDGQPAGVQDISAKSFPRRRSFTTGSWLAPGFQGLGIGKEMRQAILHLGFVGLGAEEAHSGAFTGNARSIGVSRAVGYDDNGFEISLRGGRTPDLHINFRMTRERFGQLQRPDIVIEHLGPCLELFGLDSDLKALPAP